MDLEDGQSVEMTGSSAKPYVLKYEGGIYSCTCPAWLHQSAAIDRRTCKHLKKLRGEDAEAARVGAPSPAPRKAAPSEGEDDDAGPPVLLAHRWPEDHDPTGWWMSEKLDGVRAYWDGTRFVSRLGNAFVAPPWFTEGLPSHPLDGELWGGRKRFQQTVSTVRRADGGDRWKELAFVIFDAPAHDGPFEARVEALQRVSGPYARAVEHARCEGIEHLRDELRRVEALGGEGLMLRQPGSRYEVGRSSTLLKVKTFFDAEAMVLGHVAGAGKHAGRLGSLLVQSADGVQFNVGTGFSDADRRDPPEIGSTITYRYQELSRDGVPRFPSFVGARVDAVVRAAVRQAPSSPPTTPSSPAGAGRRRFEMVEGGASKFWEVAQDGASYTTWWGKIGTAGQSKTKPASDAAAEVAKLVEEKTAKGYAEVGRAPAASSPAGSSAAAPSTPSRTASLEGALREVSARAPADLDDAEVDALRRALGPLWERLAR